MEGQLKRYKGKLKDKKVKKAQKTSQLEREAQARAGEEEEMEEI